MNFFFPWDPVVLTDKLLFFSALWGLVQIRAFAGIPIWLACAALPHLVPGGRTARFPAGGTRRALAGVAVTGGLWLIAFPETAAALVGIGAQAAVAQTILARDKASRPRTAEDRSLSWSAALAAIPLSAAAHLAVGTGPTWLLVGIWLGLSGSRGSEPRPSATAAALTAAAARHICLAPAWLTLPLLVRHWTQGWLGGIGGMRDLPIAAAVLGVVPVFALQQAPTRAQQIAWATVGILAATAGGLLDPHPFAEVLIFGVAAIAVGLANLLTPPVAPRHTALTAVALPLAVAPLAFALGFLPRFPLAAACATAGMAIAIVPGAIARTRRPAGISPGRFDTTLL